MSREPKRTIQEVMDYQTGECVYANDFFNRPLDEIFIDRSRLQQAIDGLIEPVYICYYCRQKVRIRGGISSKDKTKEEIFHFAHLRDSDACHIKTKHPYTREEVDRMKYNGAKESILHQTLKDNIAECLFRNSETKKEVSNVEIEKVIKSKAAIEWRKPDINADFFDKKIAIELQLSTTWLNVITKRQHFYKEQGIYIFWIFNSFNVQDQARKLTFDDVIYTNNQNAYVFDDETFQQSKIENDLILRCYYKWYYPNGEYLNEEWRSTLVKLSELTFDKANFKIYYHDSLKQKEDAKRNVEEFIKGEKAKERERILFMKEQEREREENIRRQHEILLREREAKQKKIKEIQENIQDLECDKTLINTRIKELEDKMRYSRSELLSRETFLTEINFHTGVVVNYLIDSNNFFTPLSKDLELLESIKEEYGSKIDILNTTIIELEKEKETISEKLNIISKIQRVEIGPISYLALDKNEFWDVIKNNYKSIRTINKSMINDLYAVDELKQIKNDYELEQVKYRSDIFFLLDHTEKIKELDSRLKITEVKIIDAKKEFESVKEDVKQKIQNSVSNKNEELKNRIIGFEKSLNKLQEDNIKLEKKIEILVNTLV